MASFERCASPEYEGSAAGARRGQVVLLRGLPDPVQDVMAVAGRVEQVRASGEDHHVRVQPHVDELAAPERLLDDDALLRVLPEILSVLEVARAGIDEAGSLRACG